MHLHEPSYMTALSFFLRRNALCSMAACLGCFAICSLPLSICVWGRRSPRPCLFWLFRVRICALCAASSTGRGRFHLETPGVTATQTVRKIKASLFWGYFASFCLAAFGWWWFGHKKKEIFKYCELNVFLWKKVLLYVPSECVMRPLHRETSLFPVMSCLLLKLCGADPPEAFLWPHELHRVTLKRKGVMVHVILSTFINC